jgi:hypothetical protein
MNCLNCGKEIKSKGNRPKLYCSESCRKAHKRTKNKDSAILTQKPTFKNAPESSVTDDLGPIRTNVPPIRTVNPDKILSGHPIRTGQVPDNYGQPDCQCKHCQNNRNGKLGLTINHAEPVNQTIKGHVNRVSLPGDVDYVGVCP